MRHRVGFMQGRLSPPVNHRVQAFPNESWREEFPLAARAALRIMEWTLDQHRLHENPLLNSAGQAEIGALSRHHELTVHSLTGDCFMQAPFWKTQGIERGALQRDFLEVVRACAAGGLTMVVLPLVRH